MVPVLLPTAGPVVGYRATFELIDSSTSLHPLAEAFGRPTWRELRAPAEALALHSAPVRLGGGSGRAVLVAPGFFGSSDSLSTLVEWLREGEFEASVVPLDRNIRGSGWAVDQIVASLDAAETPVTLIGHSRGGQQARVAAMRRPERVGHLITLGAPMNHAVPRHFALRGAVESLRLACRVGLYRPLDLEDELEYEADLFSPFVDSVAWTSIWSRSDGFVAWQACVDEAATSIEVDCSHRGLVESIASFEALATALA